jgi:hypothetical protein
MAGRLLPLVGALIGAVALSVATSALATDARSGTEAVAQNPPRTTREIRPSQSAPAVLRWVSEACRSRRNDVPGARRGSCDSLDEPRACVTVPCELLLARSRLYPHRGNPASAEREPRADAVRLGSPGGRRGLPPHQPKGLGGDGARLGALASAACRGSDPGSRVADQGARAKARGDGARARRRYRRHRVRGGGDPW